MRDIFPKFLFLSKIQTLSCKLLVTQTSNCHHCNWHAQKPIYRNFQVILCSSSWSKTTLYIFKEQILVQISCFKKIVEQLICLSLKTKDILLKTKDGPLKN